MRKFLLLLLTVTLSLGAVKADEGMWLPSLIGKQIKDMKSKGFKLSAEDIYDINKASLKDAVVMFAGGCTGEIVSAEGLLFTNHHCGYGQIQQHSSVEHDYLTNGFWAMNRGEELPNPGLEAKILVRMEDVTDRVLAETAELSGDELFAAIAKNSGEVAAEAREDGKYGASVEALYYNNQYFLFVYEVFTDVRLVAAPPSSIGKFGGDTDNWMWPRHTGDFAVFRIYANADNQPAVYSEDNVPYSPKKHFTISTKGVKEGDFTFVYGFPGATREYVVSDFVDYTLNYSNPNKIMLRDIRLNIIKEAQAKDPAIRIMYANKAANIANAWKKWQGESLGLKRLETVARKQAYEERFVEWASDKPEYGDVVAELHRNYQELQPYAFARDYYFEAFSAIELMAPASAVVGGMNDINRYDKFYKDYSADIDRKIASQVMAKYLENVSAEFIPDAFSAAVAKAGGVEAYFDDMFARSAFVSQDKLAELLSLDEEKRADALAKDPAVALVKEFVAMYRSKIMGEYSKYNNRINALYHTYMRGQMEFESEKNFYPDANLTLRVAYGKVEGYQPQDGEWHKYYTTLDGIIEKDNPEIYDYDIPQRLRDIYASKDYGRWAINTGTKKQPHYTLPVAFIASNHTTGGNSGSPVLNGRGELLGINFDRTWLSTMSDLEFDPAMCRNVAVDVRYVLFVIDKVGGAGYLLDEMTLK